MERDNSWGGAAVQELTSPLYKGRYEENIVALSGINVSIVLLLVNTEMSFTFTMFFLFQ